MRFLFLMTVFLSLYRYLLLTTLSSTAQEHRESRSVSGAETLLVFDRR
jgi:hypothetical protein